jgi:hypothetical protein
MAQQHFVKLAGVGSIAQVECWPQDFSDLLVAFMRGRGRRRLVIA